jgi:hypothetical protein
MSELVNKNNNRSGSSLLSSPDAFQMLVRLHLHCVFQSRNCNGWGHLQTIDHRGNVA